MTEQLTQNRNRKGSSITKDGRTLSSEAIRAKTCWARPMKPKKLAMADYWIDEVRKLRRLSKGEATARRVSYYSLWYRFLRLAMDCEELGIEIRTKRETKVDGRLTRYRPVRVNDSKYDGWNHRNWEKQRILFDAWWEEKAETGLFSEIGQVTEIDSRNSLTLDDARFLNLQIDITQNRRETLKAISKILDSKKTEREKLLVDEGKKYFSRFPITGRMRYRTATNRYNVLMFKLMGMKDIDILETGWIRPTDQRHGISAEAWEDAKYALEPEPFRKKDWVEKGDRMYKGAISNPSNAVAQLLGPAKQMLFSVCDGYFPFNPENSYGL